MVNQKKKGKYIGMAGALVVHVAIIALLILVGFTLPEPSEEGGVPVMLGEVPDALGAADPSLVKVDVMPEETAPQVQETVEQDIITQEKRVSFYSDLQKSMNLNMSLSPAIRKILPPPEPVNMQAELFWRLQNFHLKMTCEKKAKHTNASINLNFYEVIL